MGSLTTPTIFLDIATSAYYLFRLMAHGLAQQQFHTQGDNEKWLRKLYNFTVILLELCQKDVKKL